jgi:hypothetical protein
METGPSPRSVPFLFEQVPLDSPAFGGENAPVRKLTSAFRAYIAVRQSAERYGVRPASLLNRFIRLYRRRFSPREIFFNDLLNPKISDEALERCACREELIALDTKYALDTYLCLTADKAVFYSLCESAGIRVPRSLGIFDLPAGWTSDGRLLGSRSEWSAFARSLPADFVVKPALGLLGKGLLAFRRDGDEFVDHEGRRYTVDDLYESLCREKEQNLFSGGYSHHSLKLPAQGSSKAIIQERLYAHPAIAELTGTRAISTCRLITSSVDPSNTQIIASLFRVVTGHNIVDNFDKGKNGNLWCTVDTDTGRVVEACAPTRDRGRVEFVTRHPDTRRNVVGFQIPEWREVRALCMQLAAVFRPQPVIHWDIGVTPDGPVVVEGNLCGDVLPGRMNRPIRSLLA